MSESFKAFNLTITSCGNCPNKGRERAKSGNFKSMDYFCNYFDCMSLDDVITLYDQNKHELTTCPMLALSKGDFSMLDNMRADEQQDFGAIAWAYKKLTTYQVQNSGAENAMMMDRLMTILGGYGGAKDGQ